MVMLELATFLMGANLVLLFLVTGIQFFGSMRCGWAIRLVPQRWRLHWWSHRYDSYKVFPYLSEADKQTVVQRWADNGGHYNLDDLRDYSDYFLNAKFGGSMYIARDLLLKPGVSVALQHKCVDHDPGCLSVWLLCSKGRARDLPWEILSRMESPRYLFTYYDPDTFRYLFQRIDTRMWEIVSPDVPYFVWPTQTTSREMFQRLKCLESASSDTYVIMLVNGKDVRSGPGYSKIVDFLKELPRDFLLGVAQARNEDEPYPNLLIEALEHHGGLWAILED